MAQLNPELQETYSLDGNKSWSRCGVNLGKWAQGGGCKNNLLAAFIGYTMTWPSSQVF